MKHFAKKVELDGYTFDSQKEADFYLRFIKDSGMLYHVHPQFVIMDSVKVGGYEMRQHVYTPDFVVYRYDGSIAHVYDVKTSLSNLAVDTSAKLRFELFARRYHIPVEVVVPRKDSFKMKVFGYKNTRIQQEHTARDIYGNLKRYSNGTIKMEHYDVHKTIKYDLRDTFGF